MALRLAAIDSIVVIAIHGIRKPISTGDRLAKRR